MFDSWKIPVVTRKNRTVPNLEVLVPCKAFLWGEDSLIFWRIHTADIGEYLPPFEVPTKSLMKVQLKQSLSKVKRLVDRMMPLPLS